MLLDRNLPASTIDHFRLANLWLGLGFENSAENPLRAPVWIEQGVTGSIPVTSTNFFSAWSGKATGRDSANATISMRMYFLVETGSALSNRRANDFLPDQLACAC